jgi:hypothetical protein
MDNFELICKRLAYARQELAAASAARDDAKEKIRTCNQEIEEMLKELETGIVARPLLDAIERKQGAIVPPERQRTRKTKAPAAVEAPPP